MKVFIPIILVLLMLQSCGGSNIDPEEEYDLVDVNPVVEEGEPDADADADDDLVDVNSVVEEGESDADDDDRRDDEYEVE